MKCDKSSIKQLLLNYCTSIVSKLNKYYTGAELTNTSSGSITQISWKETKWNLNLFLASVINIHTHTWNSGFCWSDCFCWHLTITLQWWYTGRIRGHHFYRWNNQSNNDSYKQTTSKPCDTCWLYWGGRNSEIAKTDNYYIYVHLLETI